MKPIITQSDYRTIKSMLDNIPNHLRGRDTFALQKEIDFAKIVSDDSISEKVIRLHSDFSVEDTDTGKQLNFILTLPEIANLAERKLSVLSPLGVALLGYEGGQIIEWAMPSGLKKLKILRVANEHLSVK